MLTLTAATGDDAATVAMLMTALNETVGPSGVRSAVAENVTVTPDQAQRRLEAMSATEQVLLAFGDGAPAGCSASAYCRTSRKTCPTPRSPN